MRILFAKKDKIEDETLSCKVYHCLTKIHLSYIHLHTSHHPEVILYR